MEKTVQLELTVGEVKLLSAALGNRSRQEMHNDVAEDFGADTAEQLVPINQGFIFALENDRVGPLYNKLAEKIEEA